MRCSDEEAGDEEAVSRLRGAAPPAAGGGPAGAASQPLLLAHLSAWGVDHGVGLTPAHQGLGTVAEDSQGELEQVGGWAVHCSCPELTCPWPVPSLTRPQPRAAWLQGAGSQGEECEEAADAALSDHSQGAYQGDYIPAPYPGDMDAEE